MAEPTTVFNSLYDHLEWERMKSGVIRFHDNLDESSVFDFSGNLDWICEHTSPIDTPVIRVVFSSDGGGVYPALGLYDSIKRCGRDVEFLCTGLVASAAAMIVLQAATRRLAYPNTRFLLHEPSRWIFIGMERASDLKDQAAEMDRVIDIMVGILVNRCGKDPALVRSTIERKEAWMSAQEALDWGLIDEIVE